MEAAARDATAAGDVEWLYKIVDYPELVYRWLANSPEHDNARHQSALDYRPQPVLCRRPDHGPGTSCSDASKELRNQVQVARLS
jgi:hypothetical protein